MGGFFCWFMSLLVLAGIGAAMYYGLKFFGAQGLKRENEERARLAEERRQKRIAKFGHDPMAAEAAATAAELPKPAPMGGDRGRRSSLAVEPEAPAPAAPAKAPRGPAGPTIVLLNKNTRALDRDGLTEFVRSAWDVDAAVNDPSSGERIDVVDPSTVHLSIGGFDFDIIQLARIKTDVTVAARAKTADPVLHAVADGYLHALGVSFRGPADIIDDDAAYALVGKLCAQFVASDTVGLLLPKTQTLVRKTDRTAEILSGPDPIAALR